MEKINGVYNWVFYIPKGEKISVIWKEGYAYFVEEDGIKPWYSNGYTTVGATGISEDCIVITQGRLVTWQE